MKLNELKYLLIEFANFNSTERNNLIEFGHSQSNLIRRSQNTRVANREARQNRGQCKLVRYIFT